MHGRAAIAYLVHVVGKMLSKVSVSNMGHGVLPLYKDMYSREGFVKVLAGQLSRIADPWEMFTLARVELPTSGSAGCSCWRGAEIRPGSQTAPFRSHYHDE